jgi:hypothetical protein
MSLSKINQLIDIPYPRETACEKGAYLCSAAAYVGLFATNLISITGLVTVPYLPLLNLGLTGGSFLLSLPAGALKGVKLGLAKESLQTIPLGVISLLATLGVGSVGSGVNALTNMSAGILATQGISSLYYVFGSCSGKTLAKLISGNAETRRAETDAAINAAKGEPLLSTAADTPASPAALGEEDVFNPDADAV